MSVTFDFKGKVVLITGSSSGIGSGTAIMFAKSGADVVITGRNAENVAKVAEECLQISNNKSTVLQVLADITKKEDMERLVKTTIDKFGKLDVLVNNAANFVSPDLNDPNYLETHKTLFETNVDSVVYLTQLCVKYLAETKGNVINISSVAAVMTVMKNASYCMSKSALNMFTKCMAGELGHLGIRVNGINCGAIKTPPIEKMANFHIYQDTVAKLYPVGRMGEPEDIANVILFLVSDRASFITGANIAVDGGNIATNVDFRYIKF